MTVNRLINYIYKSIVLTPFHSLTPLPPFLKFTTCFNELLTQSDCISLRKEDNTIEGISDNEYWQLFSIAEFHLFCYFLLDGSILINTEDSLCREVRELTLLCLELLSFRLVLEE